MGIVRVKLNPDHLLRVARTSPVTALTELIWNSLDADAKRVAITVDRNPLGAPDRIQVTDDGTGMTLAETEVAFRDLGGSWKRLASKTKEGSRILHGHNGEGRFRAFALGDSVEWRFVAGIGATQQSAAVRGSTVDPEQFETDVDDDAGETRAGCTVTITELKPSTTNLVSDQNFVRLCGEFGPYLRQYSDVEIDFDGRKLDASVLVVKETKLEIPDIRLSDGSLVSVGLVLLEWLPQLSDRGIYLCDENGFTLDRIPGNVTSYGLHYTVHANSEYFRALAEHNGLQIGDLDPDLAAVVAKIRAETQNYLRRRQAEISRDRVVEWKTQEIYPYTEPSASAADNVERQLFDIVAVQVADYLPRFAESSKDSKRFQFTLLRQAIRENPAALQRIITDVIKLPKERQDELAELLNYTSLGNLIRSAKTVSDRIAFLHLLHKQVFEPKAKKELKERSQLHKVVASETWLFGEEFGLAVSDKGLTQALKVHLEKQRGADEVDIEGDVRAKSGRSNIIDLMLAKTSSSPGGITHDNLVIELKRPLQKIDDAVLAQVRRYAFAIADDEQFDKQNTKWTFWAVSNEITESVAMQAKMQGLPRGVFYKSDDSSITMWVRTWAELINESRARLEFFSRQLQLEGLDEAAQVLLSTKHSKYLSPADEQPTEKTSSAIAATPVAPAFE